MGTRVWIAVMVTVVCVAGVASADSPRKRDRKRKQKEPVQEPAPAPSPEPTPAPAPPSPPQDDTPWGKGVTAERKAAAEQLLGEGNALFVQNRFREALAKYEQATAQWDHPAIHFNIVRTLISLERPLDAQVSLEKALAHGEAPLDEHYTEALNYKRLIASQVGTLEISCKQPGVRVKLDGTDVLACPGTASRRVLPGPHVVVGSKAGHQTETKDVVLVGGNQLPVRIELITIAQATVYKTRWASWKPWAVAGGGVLVAGIGYLLQLQAESELDQLERSITATCPPSGCTEERYDELGHASTESRIKLQNRIAIGTMVGGGAIVVAGIVAVLLNRPKPYIKERQQPMTARVRPSITTSGAGLSLEGRF